MILDQINRFKSLADAYGFAEAMQAERQMRSRGTVTVDGLELWNDNSTAYHLVESIPKLRRLASYVPSDARGIVDVGAHCGVFGLYAKQQAPEAELVCIEADTRLEPVIKRNLAAYDGWRVVSAAAWKHSGESVTLWRSDSSTQTSSIHRASTSPFSEDAHPVTVPTVALDDTCSGMAVDVVKIDVQGAESQVLDGAVATMSRAKVLLIEVSFLDADVYGLLGRIQRQFGEPTMVNPVYAGADLAFLR